MSTEARETRRTGAGWRLRGPAVLLLVSLLIGLGVTWAAGPFQRTEHWQYRKVAEHAHNRQNFTQGLLIHEGVLYEGTGQFGESRIQRIDLESGKVLDSVSLPKRYFGEGIAVAEDELFQLTWKNRVAFVYDPETLRLLRTVRYAGQGWGLTYDGEHLVMSDGSATLRFCDPETFRVRRRVTVHEGRERIEDLNELEYVNGEIWANIWHDDQVVRIDPESGRVLGWIDLSGLKPFALRLNREAVYNGIAHDARTGKLYVTGKHWPKLYEIEIVE